MMMDVRPLHTEADYEWALDEVERYFDNPPAPGTPEADRFDVLSVLIQNHEDSHHDMPAADPIAVLHFAIENMGRSQADLARSSVTGAGFRNPKSQAPPDAGYDPRHQRRVEASHRNAHGGLRARPRACLGAR